VLKSVSRCESYGLQYSFFDWQRLLSGF